MNFIVFLISTLTMKSELQQHNMKTKQLDRQGSIEYNYNKKKE